MPVLRMSVRSWWVSPPCHRGLTLGAASGPGHHAGTSPRPRIAAVPENVIVAGGILTGEILAGE